MRSYVMSAYDLKIEFRKFCIYKPNYLPLLMLNMKFAKIKDIQVCDN